MTCLGLLLVFMGPLLLLAIWARGHSPVLILGSLAYVLVGGWILLGHARRQAPP